LSKNLFDTYTTIAASLKKAKEEKDAVSIATIYEALDELRLAWHAVK
jgi:flagellin-specific chaperone FliS